MLRAQGSVCGVRSSRQAGGRLLRRSYQPWDMRSLHVRPDRRVQDLVKKKVLHKITDEHGIVFQDRLAAGIGVMLGMEPEPPPQRDSVMIFKFVAAAEGSIDFWRQLAAGMIIGRYAKAWIMRKREERQARAEAERRSAMEDPTAMDVAGSLLTSLPKGEAGGTGKERSKSRPRPAKPVAPAPEPEPVAEPPADKAKAAPPAGEDKAEQGGAKGKEKGKKKVSKKEKVDEGVAYLGADAKKGQKGKDKKKDGDGEAAVDTAGDGKKSKGKKAAAKDAAGAPGEDKADKKKKKGDKKGKSDVRLESQSPCGVVKCEACVHSTERCTFAG